MKTKCWIDWPEECVYCGGELQVLTNAGQPNFDDEFDVLANDGDLVRCKSCYCLGWIETEDDFAEVRQPDDMCAKCYRDEIIVLQESLFKRFAIDFVMDQKAIDNIAKAWKELF